MKRIKDSINSVLGNPLTGNIDQVENHDIKGWIFNSKNRNESVEFYLVQRNKVIATGIAHEFREDLKLLGYGNGYHGFNLKLNPKNYFKNEPFTFFRFASNSKIKIASKQLEKICSYDGFNIYPEPDKNKKINPSALLILENHLFSLEYYNDQLIEHLNILDDALNHYIQEGTSFGLNPQILFDTKLYLEQSPDVAETGLNPLIHFIQSGGFEGRSPSNEFNVDIYKRQFIKDDLDESTNPLTHFLKEFVLPNNFKKYDPKLYFNEAYYLKENDDVSASGINGFRHFFSFGWKENRNPNEYFNTSFYLLLNSDIKGIDLNPFLHYIFFGFKENRPLQQSINVETLLKALNTSSQNVKLSSEVDIILPIYNGYEYLETLLPQLIKNTEFPYRLILINDCSSDKKIHPLLKTFCKKNISVVLITNSKNLGFVKSVNEGFKISKGHVVLLNSDTAVPYNWLTTLMQPILADLNIASVTPMTNAGTIASFPQINIDNPLFLNQEINSLNRAFSCYNNTECFTGPTGVGFCMAINENALKDVGLFDDETFERGYGEENDWCQRAIDKGYKNVLQPGLFVWHKHGGSFTSIEKQKLITKNSKELIKKHPNYKFQVHDHVTKNELAPFRLYSFIKACENDSQVKSELIIDHMIGGGANLYSNTLEYKIRIKKPVISITYNFIFRNYQLRVNYQNESTLEYFKSIEDLERFLALLSFDKVHYNNITSFPNQIKTLALLNELAKQNNFVFHVHDYLSICQSHTLLNSSNVFCGAETDLNVCANCALKNSHFKNKSINQESWRNPWESLLLNSNQIVCFSSSSKTILKKVYPRLKDSQITIKPHQLPIKISSKPMLSPSDELHIGIVGNITLHKGSDKVNDLLLTFNNNNYGKITIFGNLPDGKYPSERIKITGKYNVKDLPQLIELSGVNTFFFPSVCSETFSYVTDELLQMDVPVACYNLGAPAERIGNYKKGIVINANASIQETIDALEAIKKKNNEPLIKAISAKIIQSELFDEEYYLNTYSDLKEAGVSPLRHFILYGAKEKRNPSANFDTSFYLENNQDVALSSINSLVHFIDFGQNEGRLPKHETNINLFQTGIKINQKLKIAVVLHGYYDDLIIEILNYSLNIPKEYAVFVSVVSKKGKTIALDWIKKNKIKTFSVKLVENRGRDIAPTFMTFGKALSKYDLVCKIHTKKSLYTGAEQTVWRNQLVQNLIGNKQIIENIINMFQTDAFTGMVYPISKLLPYWAYTWLSNKKVGYDLQNKLGIELRISEYVDYPMGSMFWFRPKALTQLMDGRIAIEDFKEEPCGNDGTFAHAIERAFTDVSTFNGFNHIELNFETNSYAKGIGTKNLEQYHQQNLTTLLDKIDAAEVVSFDVFDTLLSRTVVHPDDAFKLLEHEINTKFSLESNFFKLRREAEKNAKLNLKKEVNYNEIYTALKQMKVLPVEVANYAFEREFEFELEISTPRFEVVEALNYAKSNGKKVLLISDMYLDKAQIKQLLYKNEVCGYDELIVSNVVNKRKDKGDMWDWLLTSGKINADTFIHVGDNEHSDIQMTVDRGLKNHHVMSSSNLFKNSKMGQEMKVIDTNWQQAAFLGPIINNLFNSPFTDKNKPFAITNLKSAFDTGHNIYGPLILSYFNWLLQRAQEDGITNFYFMAREGHFFKEMYENYIAHPEIKARHAVLPKATYFLVSRRAVIGALPKTPELLKEIFESSKFAGTLGNLLINRLGIKLDTTYYELNETQISLPKDIDLVMELIKSVFNLIKENGEQENKTFTKYLNDIDFFNEPGIALVDVGYSGTIQKHLHQITGKSLKGYYFITKDTTTKWTTEENDTFGFFENNAPLNSESPVLKFNLFLEFWLSSPDGQLAHFKNQGDDIIPVFKPKEKSKQYFHINEQITKGAITYLRNTTEINKANLEGLNIDCINAQVPFKISVLEDLWDIDTRKIAFLEDEFSGNTENMNIITEFKKYVI